MEQIFLIYLQEVLSFAPLHLMRLEFRLDEATFNQYLKEIEKEIHAEQQSFNRHEDVESILARNRVRTVILVSIL